MFRFVFCISRKIEASKTPLSIRQVFPPRFVVIDY